MKTATAALDLKAILQPLDGDLERVTQRLLECLENPIARRAAYLITAGGKRLRPALVLLAGRSGTHRASPQSLIDLATAIELVHTATLIHDDIIDRAIFRRKQPSFHQRFGTERAVLMGDYLYASAFSILAGIGDSYVTDHMAKVCQDLSRGEFLEVDTRYDLQITEETYLQIVRDKTASLIAASSHLGAYVAGAARETIDRVSSFGLNYGIAFQIMDDCLDLIGHEKTVGKPLLSDLEKGSLSLPVIYLVKRLAPRERAALFKPLKTKHPVPSFLGTVAAAAKRTGAIDEALRRADRFITEATEAVAEPDGVMLLDTYRQLADYALQRVH